MHRLEQTEKLEAEILKTITHVSRSHDLKLHVALDVDRDVIDEEAPQNPVGGRVDVVLDTV